MALVQQPALRIVKEKIVILKRRRRPWRCTSKVFTKIASFRVAQASVLSPSWDGTTDFLCYMSARAAVVRPKARGLRIVFDGVALSIEGAMSTFFIANANVFCKRNLWVVDQRSDLYFFLMTVMLFYRPRRGHFCRFWFNHLGHFKFTMIYPALRL